MSPTLISRSCWCHCALILIDLEGQLYCNCWGFCKKPTSIVICRDRVHFLKCSTFLDSSLIEQNPNGLFRTSLPPKIVTYVPILSLCLTLPQATYTKAPTIPLLFKSHFTLKKNYYSNCIKWKDIHFFSNESINYYYPIIYQYIKTQSPMI